MSFRPGIDIRGKSFRQIHSTDGIAAGAWTTDRVVGIFLVESGTSQICQPTR